MCLLTLSYTHTQHEFAEQLVTDEELPSVCMYTHTHTHTHIHICGEDAGTIHTERRARTHVCRQEYRIFISLELGNSLLELLSDGMSNHTH